MRFRPIWPLSCWLCFQEKDINLSGEHVREGLTCIVSVKIPNPEFEGQTKVLGEPHNDRLFSNDLWSSGCNFSLV